MDENVCGWCPYVFQAGATLIIATVAAGMMFGLGAIVYGVGKDNGWWK